MKIYIATKKQDVAVATRRKLKETFQDKVSFTSSWIDQESYGNTPICQKTAIAKRCDKEVRECDLLINIADEANVPGGKHVELGVALALDKKVIALGRRENIFHYHPEVVFCETEDKLIESIKEILDDQNTCRMRKKRFWGGLVQRGLSRFSSRSS